MELFHPTYLGGGFRDFLFSPFFGEDFQFDEHIFHMGWFNHQPVICHDWCLGPPYTSCFLSEHLPVGRSRKDHELTSWFFWRNGSQTLKAFNCPKHPKDPPMEGWKNPFFEGVGSSKYPVLRVL